MASILRPALVMFGTLTLLCGVVYPAVVTGIGRVAFAHQVDGSLIEVGGKRVGSSLIGQPFAQPGYFWGRPSASAPQPYNALASGGSNQGPLNPALLDKVKAAAQALRGVRYRAIGATALLRRNLLIYGIGGIILPFIGIKLIDLLLASLNLV